MMDRKAAGLTSLGLLEARDGATDDDKMLIAEENIKRRKRFEDIAKESGVSMEAVQRRHAAKIRERIPAGSGVWYQNGSRSDEASRLVAAKGDVHVLNRGA